MLLFYPSNDASAVSCLWEAPSTDQVRRYVDEVLGDASENAYFEVDADEAFAERPLGLPTSPTAE